jgi:hypothetical protein
MMQETPIQDTEISLGSLVCKNDQVEKPWDASEVEVAWSTGIKSDRVADSNPTTWRKYCDGRLRQFRASR